MSSDRKNNTEAAKGELVTVGDIAKLTGNRPSAVNNWEKRNSDFPDPVELLPNGRRLFDLNEVLAWLRANEKLDGESANPERSAALALFELMRTWGFGGGTACLAACELVGVNAMAKRSAAARGWDVEWLKEEAEAMVKDLDENFGADLFSRLRGTETWLDMEKATSDLVGDLDPTKVFDQLLEVGSNSTGPFEFFPVPQSVKDLVVGVLPKRPRQVIDIAAGTADLLATVALGAEVASSTFGDPFISWQDTSDMSSPGDRGQLRVIGFETDQLRARLGQLRLSVHEMNGVVLQFDALSKVPEFQGTIAALASIVPFGQKFDDESPDDLDWRFGVPPRADTSLGWIQRAIALLAPNGTGVVITSLPPTNSSRKQDEEIRAALLRNSCVEAVIELPGGTFSHTGIGTALWLIRAPREVLRPDPVLLIDLASGGSTRKRGEEWPPGLAARAVAAVENFRKSPDDFLAEPSFSRVVSISDLMPPKGSLLPSNFIGARLDAPPAKLIEEVHAAKRSALSALEALTREGELPLAELETSDAPTTSTLKQLRDAGALTIVRREHALPGDIVIGISKRKIITEIVEQERVTKGHEVIIRNFETTFDSVFLAAVLTSTQNQKIGIRGTTLPGIDAMKLAVPTLDIEKQKGMRDQVAAPKHLADLALNLEAAANEWAQAAVDAVASGGAQIRGGSEVSRSSPDGDQLEGRDSK